MALLVPLRVSVKHRERRSYILCSSSLWLIVQVCDEGVSQVRSFELERFMTISGV